MNKWRNAWVFLLLLSVAVGLRVAGANPASAQTAVVGAWRFTADPGMDGTGQAWQSVPPVWVSTTPQLVTPPMGGGEVGRVAVRAGHWGEHLFVMLEWADSTPDLGSQRVEDFADAAAVQFPAEAGTAVPALCMGQADQAVNIWHWRADLQEGVPESQTEYVDLHPVDDDLYSPARALGNPVAGSSTAQNLLAGGFGTLTPSQEQVVTGHGVHANGRWTVVFSRSMDSPGSFQPSFVDRVPIDTAFAVWNGALDHRNGVKSVSSFVQLRPTDQGPPGESDRATSTRLLIVPAAGLLLLAGMVVVAVRDRGPVTPP